jgi:hypothetical protein
MATTQTAQPAPAAGKPLETLRTAVKAFAPTAVLEMYEHLKEDGFHPAVYSYGVKLSGPEVRNAVKAKGINIADVVLAAKQAWRRERRATEVFRLVEQCQVIVGGCLEEAFEEALKYEMEGCPFSSFDTLAAKWRSQSVGYAQQQAA